MRRQTVTLPYACGHQRYEDVAAGTSPQALAQRVSAARERPCPSCRLAAEEAARRAQETPETRTRLLAALFPD